VEVNLDPSEQG
jgi:hypothetical protein